MEGWPSNRESFSEFNDRLGCNRQAQESQQKFGPAVDRVQVMKVKKRDRHSEEEVCVLEIEDLKIKRQNH